ncbi:spore germination protein [Polycladomyces subterraneus]|uniref:Spore germination protein n=1 Tax=Polycladomyces subterraneus TaxID=1016997 RepID=A0ABT8IQH2_9BACL|nr:spore germination protein [Polycladomyces subterraneus]MDN4594662.1 spore germination protein [Polycladomyces subterraneus]
MRVRPWTRKKKRRSEKGQTNHEALRHDGSILSTDLEENLDFFRSIYADSFDVTIRSFLIGGKRNAALIYIVGLSNVEEIHEHILEPLMQEHEAGSDSLFTSLKNKLIPVVDMGEGHTRDECVEHLSTGEPVLLIDGEARALFFGLQKWDKRAVEEPTAETIIRGPREGFTETLTVNSSLIRRRIRNPGLKMKAISIGRQTRTKVVVAYIQENVDSTLVEEVFNRLQRIDIDGVLESGYLEEFIEDNPYSPFPQVINTERVDIVAANLLEGRVAILMEGTPFAIVVPATLATLMQSPEDYYQRFIIGTAIRWLRYLFVGLSLLLPSLYVAVISYHQELIPTSLLVTIASSRDRVPFPALVEALLMEIMFEILREAGIRLPKQVGAAVSIVGALVIGQAAVSAGLVSSPMVMVVAITGIASFATPRYTTGIAFRLLRFPIMVLAGSMGLVGIILGLIFIVVHLCTLRSFGVPYLAPLATTQVAEFKDVIIRAPWWKMDRRPHFTGKHNANRMGPNLKPDPSKGGEK